MIGGGSELLGKTIRLWDFQRASVFVQGEVIAWTDQPTVTVRTACECGREKLVTHIAALPIDVMQWVSR